MTASSTVAAAAAHSTHDFELDLPHLRFPSYPIDGGFVFRVSGMNEAKAPCAVLELESKRLKTKWECKVSCPNDYCPAGYVLPQELTFSSLKAALAAQGQPESPLQSLSQLLSTPKEWLREDGIDDEAAVVDLVCQIDGSMKLCFDTKLFATRKLCLSFQFTPVAMDSLDVMNRRLKDIQAELVRLEDAAADKQQAVQVIAVVCSILWMSLTYFGMV